MIKKEILIKPLSPHPIEEGSEPPMINTIDSIGDLSMDEANMNLSYQDKKRWVNAHNGTANLYHINQMGQIQKVPPAGWWY